MRKSIFGILLTGVLVGFLAVSALASGTVIRFSYIGEGVSFRLYKIGEFDSRNNFVVSEKFEEYSVNFRNSGSAGTLLKYIERDHIAPSQTAVTDGSCTAYFEGVESGYYLIEGDSFSDGEYVYTAQPVLLTVYENGDYYLDVTGKYEANSVSGGGEKNSVSVLKVWSGGTGAESVTVQLLRDGEVYEEVLLNSGNNWRYTWSGLGSGDWQAVEKEVPEGYKVSIEKDGTVFVLTNTYEPDTAEPPTEVTTEKPTEATTKKPSSGGGGGGGTVIVNTTEATTEETTEEKAEGTTEAVTEGERETVIEDEGEETTRQYSEYKEGEIPPGEGSEGSEMSDGSSSGGISIGEESIGSSSTAGSSSAGENSSAGISSVGEGSEASAVNEGEEGGARLPQTGQLWFPVPWLCCGGILCLILGIGRRRTAQI